jgi:hypothetical protein
MQNTTQTAIDLDAINNEIAIKVMGWEKPPRDQVGWVIDGKWTGARDYYCDWSPMTDIRAAFEVEERIAELNLQQPYLQALWDIVGADANYDDVKGRFLFKHASPELICKAALLALAATK